MGKENQQILKLNGNIKHSLSTCIDSVIYTYKEFVMNECLTTPHHHALTVLFRHTEFVMNECLTTPQHQNRLAIGYKEFVTWTLTFFWLATCQWVHKSLNKKKENCSVLYIPFLIRGPLIWVMGI